MITIAKQTDEYLVAFCPWHEDRGRPNLRIDLKGDFAGTYHCFGCGAHGNAKDLGINIKRVKSQRKKPRDFYSVWLNLPYAPTTVYEWPVWNNAPFKLLESYGMKYIEKEGCAVYPMVDEHHKIIGLQRRFENDRKISIKHSRLGCFAPNEIQDQPVYVTEGFSDCIATASLSLFAIGRPCAGSVDVTAGWLMNWTKQEIIIVSDRNVVGWESSKKLKNILQSQDRNARIAISKEKDIRMDVKKYGKQVLEWL